MQTFQYEQFSADPDKPLGDIRALTDADIERLVDEGGVSLIYDYLLFPIGVGPKFCSLF